MLQDKLVQSPPSAAQERPIFICGTGRSGTSILQVVLARHTNIFSLRYEGRFIVSEGGLLKLLESDNARETLEVFREKILGEWFQRISRKGQNEEYLGGLYTDIDKLTLVRLVDDLEGEIEHVRNRDQKIRTIRDFICRLYRAAREGTHKERWLEKTPANILYMPELLEIFPHAKFLHVYRDGRDVAASIIDKNFWPIWKNDVVPIYKKLKTKTVKNGAIYWREMLRYGFETGHLFSSDNYKEIRMEELVAKPRERLTEICEYIGEEFDEKMLKVDLSKANIGRWREIFSQRDREDFKQEAGDLLVELGYERDGSW